MFVALLICIPGHIMTRLFSGGNPGFRHHKKIKKNDKIHFWISILEPHESHVEKKLEFNGFVGGFNPFEKYESKWVSSPMFGVKIKNIWVATTQNGCVGVLDWNWYVWHVGGLSFWFKSWDSQGWIIHDESEVIFLVSQATKYHADHLKKSRKWNSKTSQSGRQTHLAGTRISCALVDDNGKQTLLKVSQAVT